MTAVTFVLLATTAVALVLLCGCADDELPDYYLLGGLRILALKADPSEVDPSAGAVTVPVTPLVTDIVGNGRALTFTTEACTDPGVGLGATPTCDHDPLKVTTTGTSASAAPRFTGAFPPVNVTVPPSVFDGRSEVDRYNGVPYLFIYRLTAPDGSRVSAFRRIIATNRGTRNTLPSITGMESAGAALTELPAAAATLVPKLGAAGETYTVKLEDGTLQEKTETLTITWFVSAGEVKFTRTEGTAGNPWTPPATAPSGALFLVATVRDNRGGLDFVLVGP